MLILQFIGLIILLSSLKSFVSALKAYNENNNEINEVYNKQRLFRNTKGTIPLFFIGLLLLFKNAVIVKAVLDFLARLNICL